MAPFGCSLQPRLTDPTMALSTAAKLMNSGATSLTTAAEELTMGASLTATAGPTTAVRLGT